LVASTMVLATLSLISGVIGVSADSESETLTATAVEGTSPFWYGPNGQRCAVGWDAGGHSDAANNKCCQSGRKGDTKNCAAPELFIPPGDNNPDICCYWRESVNKYFYKPTKIVASWKSMGALDPTHQVCKTIGTEVSESVSENYEKQVTDSLTAGFGVEFEGMSASTSATHSVQQTWSKSSTWSRKMSVSTTDCEQMDVVKDYVKNGWIWKWQWSATTTTKWGTTYETDFGDSAYTPNAAYSPKCVPGFYAPGHYPDYQQCDSASRIDFENRSMLSNNQTQSLVI